MVTLDSPRHVESELTATSLASAGGSPAGRATVDRLAEEPVRAQIDRLAAQIAGLQNGLDALIARRSEAMAERASRHVASIVTAAEQSAAEIRARAEEDGAAIRDRLLSDARIEVERIRGEAHAQAPRIRGEAATEGVPRVPHSRLKQIASEVEHAVGEVRTAIKALEQSVRHVGTVGGTEQQAVSG